MADKKTHMGDDPLAWLAEEGQAAEKAVAAPKRTRTRRTSRKKTAAVKTEIELVKESFAILGMQGEELVSRFYEQLFEQNPKLAPLFDTVSVVGQQKKLLASLVLLVQNLDKPEVLKDYLLGLGARHVHYGVSQEQYQMFTDALISVMSEMIGKKWTSPVNDAWQNTLNNVTSIMLEAYKPVEADEMATNKQADNQDLLTMRAAVDGATIALMMCDANRVITYANPAAMSLLQNRLTELRKVFPGLNLKKLIGTCIDDFHKDPSLQKGILSDVDNLPYRAQIQLLDIHFDLNATAIVDADGNYMGNMVEWQDITEQRKRDIDAQNTIAEYKSQITAIDKAMGIISFELDGTIIDINDNFLETTGYKEEEVIGQHHRMFAEPDFANTAEYTEFWAKLNRGEFDAGEYKRVGKGGKTVWLQASYNPIFDIDGNPVKVMKYATDITDQKKLQLIVEKIMVQTSSVMNAVSTGDLTQKLEGDYEGEFAMLQTSINETISNLSQIVNDINDSTVSISTAATEISEGNIDLSQRTEQQASSLEETASSMEELTSTVRQNSDNARQANQLAASSREQAEKGGSVIKEAIEAMSAISSSSKKVTDIIGVIDEIAFQTNLLALNAAVEAARAGEQGRGFAVVASEVRNLAQRSASAAKEIKELINDSGEKVKEGSSLVDESGRTLEEIVASSKKVGDIISEIAAAGAEQTQGIEQVTKAVGQMDEMTQQNAALVEQAAAASESLDDQGKNLQRLMSFFEAGDEDDTPEPVVAPKKVKAKPAAKKAKATLKSAPVADDDDDDEWDEF